MRVAGGSDFRAVGAVTDQSASVAGSLGSGSAARAAGSPSSARSPSPVLAVPGAERNGVNLPPAGHVSAGGLFGREAVVAARRAAIAAQFRPGVGASVVAARMGVSPNTARTDLRAIGWPLAARSCKRITPRSALILAAVAAEPHRTLGSFGAQFGVTGERIRQIIRKRDCKKLDARFSRHAQARAQVQA